MSLRINLKRDGWGRAVGRRLAQGNVKDTPAAVAKVVARVFEKRLEDALRKALEEQMLQ
jgi:hypothetical protein